MENLKCEGHPVCETCGTPYEFYLTWIHEPWSTNPRRRQIQWRLNCSCPEHPSVGGDGHGFGGSVHYGERQEGSDRCPACYPGVDHIWAVKPEYRDQFCDEHRKDPFNSERHLDRRLA
jgi:hypothetical protein